MARIHTFWFVTVVYLAIDSKVESTPEIMKELTVQFGKFLDDCLDELGLSKNIYTDFSSYWREDFKLTNRDTGCVISCLAKKLDMQHHDGLVHKTNSIEFAKKHGADHEMAVQLVDTLHDCEKSISNSDECARVMEVANCFKVEVHKLNWAPSPELMAGEFLLEV